MVCECSEKRELVIDEFIMFLAKRFCHTALRGGGYNYVRTQLEELDKKISRIDAKTEIEFLSKLVHLPQYSKRKQQKYGELGQDLIAYSLFGGKKDGFYIDIGAHDGVVGSNSLLFEENGWNGICIEPNPQIFERLRKNRKCDCYNLAIFSQDIDKMKLATSGNTGLSTLEVNLDDYQRKRLCYDYGKNYEIQYIEVQAITFDRLMKDYPDVYHIDFISMDIEGGEFEVLRGIDFDRYTFSLMVIEKHPRVKHLIPNFLKSKGYRMLMTSAWDFYFVPDDHIGWERPYELEL